MEVPEILHDEHSIWFHFQMWDYEITWDRIKDQDGLLSWIDHIAGKRWCTPEVLRTFIARVQRHYGWRRVFP
jgi:hypothetical protein